MNLCSVNEIEDDEKFNTLNVRLVARNDAMDWMDLWVMHKLFVLPLSLLSYIQCVEVIA